MTTWAVIDSATADAGTASAVAARHEPAPHTTAARSADTRFMSCRRFGRITEERIDERLGLERCEIVGAFTQPDELDRHA